jgi:hypothetical protein
MQSKADSSRKRMQCEEQREEKRDGKRNQNQETKYQACV